MIADMHCHKVQAFKICEIAIIRFIGMHCPSKLQEKTNDYEKHIQKGFKNDIGTKLIRKSITDC